MSYISNGLNQGKQAADTVYTYDANGNIASDGWFTFSYDSDNELTSALPINAGVRTLTYDPLGRLYQLSTASSSRRFLYAPGDSGLPEIIEEYDGAGGLAALYANGPGPDEPLFWGDPGIAYRSLHADERGSIIAVGDGAGGAYAINRYDEYGQPQGGGITGRFGYTGQAWLPEIGIYYYRARMYWAHERPGGRFLQTDPVGPVDSPNLYQYALNDPVNLVDPWGLSTVIDCNANPDSCQIIITVIVMRHQIHSQFADETATISFSAMVHCGAIPIADNRYS